MPSKRTGPWKGRGTWLCNIYEPSTAFHRGPWFSFYFFIFYFFVSVLMFHKSLRGSIWKTFPRKASEKLGSLRCGFDSFWVDLYTRLKKQAQIWTREKVFCLPCLRVQRSVRQVSLALNPSVPPELKLQTAEDSRGLSSCPAAPDFFKKILFLTQVHTQLPRFFVEPPFLSLHASLEYVYSGWAQRLQLRVRVSHTGGVWS